MTPAPDTADALVQVIANLDPIRGRLLADVVYGATGRSEMGSFDAIQQTMQSRITYVVGEPGVPTTLNRMDSDGSGKSAMLVLDSVSRSMEPSRALHGGHRWFLQWREIPGQYDPSGTARREMFAVRSDGNETFTK